MIILAVVLVLFLAASIISNIYLYQQLLDARNRTYEDELWIDPIGWEESK